MTTYNVVPNPKTLSDTDALSISQHKYRKLAVYLDYETFSKVNLVTDGVFKYTAHESFKILLASVTVQDLNTNTLWTYVLDFVASEFTSTRTLIKLLSEADKIYAHNSEFEELCTLRGLDLDLSIIDTAALCRAAGFSGSLEGAAAQILDGPHKNPEGKRLIRKFCIGERPPTYDKIRSDPDWLLFRQYAYTDSELLPLLMRQLRSFWDDACGVSSVYQAIWTYSEFYMDREIQNAAVTRALNRNGWTVDIPLVHLMKEQSEANTQALVEAFQDKYCTELNVNSHKQLTEWTKKHNVNMVSFDKLSVEKALKKIGKRLDSSQLTQHQRDNLESVQDLLQLKQAIGGSSVSKLETILAQTNDDGLLQGQYLHAGANQTWRTSGRGVQMQNLPRLGEQLDFTDIEIQMTNEQIIDNLRQVFIASCYGGRQIVGDFASIESRLLAWLAGELGKVMDFINGIDPYKKLGAHIYQVAYEDVTYDQRRTGKVGDLGCGYMAGVSAIQAFAEGFGLELTEVEAQEIVDGYRSKNTRIVAFWAELDALLRGALDGTRLGFDQGVEVGINSSKPKYRICAVQIPTPASLLELNPAAQSIAFMFRPEQMIDCKVEFFRVFHGVHLLGRGLGYYKPNVTGGVLWKNTFMHPKLKREMPYTIYGGKLAGIMTQSLAREIFFHVLRQVNGWGYDNLRTIGQFHDEIVLDWRPERSTDKASISFHAAVQKLEDAMRGGDAPPILHGFPLDAEVQASYRYIK